MSFAYQLSRVLCGPPGGPPPRLALENASIITEGNAAYWYRRARKPVCKASLDEEWAAIADALLKGEGGEAA